VPARRKNVLLSFYYSIYLNSCGGVMMQNYRTIPIDLEVHKLIETERKSFDEPENDIVRRLLKLKPKSSAPSGHIQSVGARAWSGDGVSLPHGTHLRMAYNGVSHYGEITDGKWLVEGNTFDSPSAAAGGAARTRQGSSASLNGWSYWEVKRPGDANWIPLKDLRRPLTIEDIV
jgi:hypothetical protein